MKFLKGFRFDPLNVVETVAGILGERDTTNETRQKLQDMDYPHIRDLLPYKDYDTESQIWVNKESVGFVVESQPLIGANEKLAESLEYLLRDVAPRYPAAGDAGLYPGGERAGGAGPAELCLEGPPRGRM